ncbi:MAG TPA: ATP-binding cassette domain-containing protein [Polyangiaceae bacterium]
MISVSHLSRRYGGQPRPAVDDVSFAIGSGEVVGFLGPNGAGKTTTLRILAGFLAPSSGTVTVAGHDVADDSLEARRNVGYMAETSPLYGEMRVVEFLRFRAELKGVARRDRAAWIDDAMGKAGVLDVAHKRIAHLSKGYRQRVGLADAVLARPPVVLLDEPTAGLDPNQIREARRLVRDLGRDHTVVLSTHILGEVEACATRVLLMHQGKLVAEGPTETIRSMRTANAVELVVRGDEAAALKALGAVAGVSKAACVGGGDGAVHLRATFRKKLADAERATATEACVAALVAAGAGVREVRSAGGSLEEVFAALTREETREETPEKSEELS